MAARCLVVVILAARAAQPQSIDRLEFEVASIKRSAPDNQRFSIDTQPGGRFTTSNSTVRALIRMAYHVYDFQIAKTPGWIDTENYDIAAKSGGQASDAQIQRMVQTLLADRFKLALHRETRELPVYALVVARGGSKLHEAAPGDFGPMGRLSAGPGGQPGAIRVVAKGVPLVGLAAMLPTLLGRPALDMSGLAGKYDFTLEFAPDQMMRGPSDGGPDSPLPDLSGTSIFAALQEQLGLRLEVRKGPVEVLVIDRVERPTEN